MFLYSSIPYKYGDLSNTFMPSEFGYNGFAIVGVPGTVGNVEEDGKIFYT